MAIIWSITPPPSVAHNCNRSKRFGKFWSKSDQSKGGKSFKNCFRQQQQETPTMIDPRKGNLGNNFHLCVLACTIIMLANRMLKRAYQRLKHALDQTSAQKSFQTTVRKTLGPRVVFSSFWTMTIRIVCIVSALCARGVLIMGVRDSAYIQQQQQQ